MSKCNLQTRQKTAFIYHGQRKHSASSRKRSLTSVLDSASGNVHDDAFVRSRYSHVRLIRVSHAAERCCLVCQRSDSKSILAIPDVQMQPSVENEVGVCQYAYRSSVDRPESLMETSCSHSLTGEEEVTIKGSRKPVLWPRRLGVDMLPSPTLLSTCRRVLPGEA